MKHRSTTLRRTKRKAGPWVCLIPGVALLAAAGLSVQAAPVQMPDGGAFDPEYYAEENPDVTGALGTDPEVLYRHYESFGAGEGRLPFAPGTDLSNLPVYQRPGRTPVMQDGVDYHEIPDEDDSVTFTFAGDINMDPGFVAGQTIRRKGLAGCFDAAALDAMRSSDIFMLNNEFTYSTNSNHSQKKWTFQTRPSDAAMLADIGTDIVSIANNHIYDFGATGFYSTLAALEKAGMPYVGGGRNISEASAPYYYKAGNMTIAVVAATEIERYANPVTQAATATRPGVFHCYDPSRLYSVIRDAKTKADYVIAFVHWGTEQRKTPDTRQLQLARGMTDAGADLIIGDHSHCQETLGWIGDVPVVYSLGNYVFATYTQDTCLFRVTLRPSEGKMVKAEYLPLRCRSDCSVYTPVGRERSAALARERALSPDVVIGTDGTVTPKR